MKRIIPILRQHRIMGQGDSARDFGPAESSENAGILCVFPIFRTVRMGQKTRRSPQLPPSGVALIALLLLSGCGAVSAEKTYRQITMEEAVTMMEEETGYIILDVRTAQEYGEKHIPGAINIANESIGTEDISELPDKDQLILVYCRSGNRSKQASEKLVKLGYTNIIEIGGINSWPGETVTGDK